MSLVWCWRELSKNSSRIFIFCVRTVATMSYPVHGKMPLRSVRSPAVRTAESPARQIACSLPEVWPRSRNRRSDLPGSRDSEPQWDWRSRETLTQPGSLATQDAIASASYPVRRFQKNAIVRGTYCSQAGEAEPEEPQQTRGTS